MLHGAAESYFVASLSFFSAAAFKPAAAFQSCVSLAKRPSGLRSTSTNLSAPLMENSHISNPAVIPPPLLTIRADMFSLDVLGFGWFK